MPDIKKKFDVVVMNPPYQIDTTGGNGARDFWDKFIPLSISLCKTEGYMVHVHPSKWRKPEHDSWKLLTSKQIKFLSIHSKKEGQKTFGATTRYDWYVVQNSIRTERTIVKQEGGMVVELDLGQIPFLPNYGLENLLKILAKDGEEKCDIIYSSSIYDGRKDWMKDKETKEYKYPCVYGMYQDGSIKWLYSSQLKGHFGISKVILSTGEHPYPLIDMDGEYGMCNNAFAIQVSSQEEAEGIKKALETPIFKEIFKSTKWGNFQIDWKMFKYFRKDFWKEFI